MRGTHTSTNTGDPAAKILTAAFNLTLEIHGVFYGAGGTGGTSSSLSGTNGGTALSINSGRVTVDIQPSGRLWGGGGGGEFGADGTFSRYLSKRSDNVLLVAQLHLAQLTIDIKCTISWWLLCITKILVFMGDFVDNTCVGIQVGTCRKEDHHLHHQHNQVVMVDAGRGFNNFSGSLLGSRPKGNCPSCVDTSFTLQTGTGSCGGEGGTGALVVIGVKMGQTQEHLGQVDRVDRQSLELVLQ